MGDSGRQIAGLLRAAPCDRPHFIPKTKARGANREGLVFEAKVGRQLARYGARHGQWFEFWDANGRGYCQPDVVILRPKFTLVFECKRTVKDYADTQLIGLYVPILQHVYGVPVLSFVVAKNLTSSVDRNRIATTLDSALLLAINTGAIPIIHWLGNPDRTFDCSVL